MVFGLDGSAVRGRGGRFGPPAHTRAVNQILGAAPQSALVLLETGESVVKCQKYSAYQKRESPPGIGWGRSRRCPDSIDPI